MSIVDWLDAHDETDDFDAPVADELRPDDQAPYEPGDNVVAFREHITRGHGDDFDPWPRAA